MSELALPPSFKKNEPDKDKAEMGKKKICPKCKLPNKADALNCKRCGTKLVGIKARDKTKLDDPREQLELAQEARRHREDQAELADIGVMLENCGLADARREGFTIDPGEAQQLKGIIARLRKVPHPFTTCMRDLRKHKPEWNDERRKRTCQSLKQAAGRTSGKATAMAMADEGVCVLITDGIATLLERLDPKKLAEFYAKEEK